MFVSILIYYYLLVLVLTLGNGTEVEHTRTEKNILINNNHPFLVNLKFAFQTEKKIYFVLGTLSLSLSPAARPSLVRKPADRRRTARLQTMSTAVSCFSTSRRNGDSTKTRYLKESVGSECSGFWLTRFFFTSPRRVRCDSTPPRSRSRWPSGLGGYCSSGSSILIY